MLHTRITDTSNNIGRRCDVLGRKDRPHRDWTVRYALHDPAITGLGQNVVTHYGLVSGEGQYIEVPTDAMTYLY